LLIFFSNASANRKTRGKPNEFNISLFERASSGRNSHASRVKFTHREKSYSQSKQPKCSAARRQESASLWNLISGKFGDKVLSSRTFNHFHCAFEIDFPSYLPNTGQPYGRV